MFSCDLIQENGLHFNSKAFLFKFVVFPLKLLLSLFKLQGIPHARDVRVIGT